jgi:hypothetical protein
MEQEQTQFQSIAVNMGSLLQVIEQIEKEGRRLNSNPELIDYLSELKLAHFRADLYKKLENNMMQKSSLFEVKAAIGKYLASRLFKEKELKASIKETFYKLSPLTILKQSEMGTLGSFSGAKSIETSMILKSNLKVS